VKIMAKPERGRSSAVVDDHIGGRIRERRIMLGLTQQQLAEMIGVSYQQAHKYERGINRVSAGRLFEIARALSAPITYFYEGIGEEGPPQITLHQRMQLEMARNFAEIRNERHQEAVSQLARALANR
jgi:transcriptional regulator with XRE-family HTH domain